LFALFEDFFTAGPFFCSQRAVFRPQTLKNRPKMQAKAGISHSERTLPPCGQVSWLSAFAAGNGGPSRHPTATWRRFSQFSPEGMMILQTNRCIPWGFHVGTLSAFRSVRDFLDSAGRAPIEPRT
jgi:hypothetical protein